MGIISGGGGGATYTPPTVRQQLSGNNLSIANGGNARLTWDTSFGPSVLLDRSTPDLPAVLVAGIYAVSVQVIPSAITAGGTFQVALELDRDGTDGGAAMDSAAGSALLTTPQLVVGLTFYIPLAGTIAVTVRNHDGAATRDFGISIADVQRIT